MRGPARALLVIEEPVLAGIVRLALNHGQYDSRVAASAHEASAVLAGWRPHLVVVDMDIEGSAILERVADHSRKGAPPPPLIALTRRGDLKAKLAAFERGVDDILTVPFSPEEFVARVVAIMRRSYRDPLMFTPVLRVGDLEIDILNRRVRIGDTALHLTSLEQSLLYCWPPTRAACSPATRSSTISGAPTTWRRATWSTATSTTCVSSCRTTRTGRATSPRFPGAATFSPHRRGQHFANPA